MTPLFADAVSAADDIPADKQAVLDSQPSTGTNDPDDTVEGGNSPVKPAVADVGSATDLSAIKTAVTSAQTKFNTAQMLPADRTARIQQAQAIANDVNAASGLGVAAFVSGARATTAVAAKPTDFRVKMVQIFDPAVVVDESLDLAAQLLTDAQSTDLPSMVQSSFAGSSWQGVQVTGDTATALLVGSYTNCFAGGAFATSECTDPLDMQWQFGLHRGTDGVWRLTERVGVSADPAPLLEETGPPPSEEPSADPPTTPAPTATIPEPTATVTIKPTTTWTKE